MRLKNLIPAILILSILLSFGSCQKKDDESADQLNQTETLIQSEISDDELLTADFIFTDTSGNPISSRNVAFEYDLDVFYDNSTDENGLVTISNLYPTIYNLLHLEDGNQGELAFGNFYFIIDTTISEPQLEISSGGSIVVSIPQSTYKPTLSVTIDKHGFLSCTAVK